MSLPEPTQPRKPNASPRGPSTVTPPLTGRALRRAMGQTGKWMRVWIAAGASSRAPKRQGGGQRPVNPALKRENWSQNA